MAKRTKTEYALDEGEEDSTKSESLIAAYQIHDENIRWAKNTSWTVMLGAVTAEAALLVGVQQDLPWWQMAGVNIMTLLAAWVWLVDLNFFASGERARANDIRPRLGLKDLIRRSDRDNKTYMWMQGTAVLVAAAVGWFGIFEGGGYTEWVSFIILVSLCGILGWLFVAKRLAKEVG